MTGPRVRVLVYAAAPDGSKDALTDAYHHISQELSGTPGLLGNELLCSLTEPGGFLVMSEWDSLDSFRAWEEGTRHRQTTAPLRSFQDRSRGPSFALYTVNAAYPEERS
ncbi:antibiotic biosynthesis monooxygenase [Spongiactinospora gelatinilytica]|uniref:Antibiotic biosynthesis monooxygenase n=1 Tax=Spongiactinospora gelatinilytica TaxID=2666298 RepID=A0A2W2GDK8_9ACTN|nr:antibiotic biosynthesis monooxygenase [Spongiactinospora gelatinilytica]PZG35028.1 antibiotic biosynthesis monooxygenase [Spongiactinospora gelatinilytica]